MKRATVAALGTTISLCALAAPIAASAADAPAPAAKADGIQEIVVTATRVETSAQKTPIALTVYGGADLLEKGVTTVSQLAGIDPSINISTKTGASYIAVRGIASTDLTEIGDPSVPIARDGFYVNRSYAIQTSMYDLSRVEVLKGPQGTLNGRNSTGGLISVITQRPELRDGGYFDLGVGNYGAIHAEGAVNLALSDTLAIRASGFGDAHNGYRVVTLAETGGVERGDDNDAASGRIQLLWKPLPDLQLWASYQHDNIGGVGDVSENLAYGAIPSLGDGKHFANGAPTSVKLTDDRVRWEVQYNALPGGLHFIYAGGYDVVDWQHKLDATGTYPAFQQFVQHEHPKTWNHEARISNNANSTFFIQAGYFHFQEDNALTSGILDGPMNNFLFLPGGPFASYATTGQYGILFQYPEVLAKSDAVFGSAAYKVSDQLKLSAGVRMTWDNKTRVGNATLYLPALAFPICGLGFPTNPNACPPFPIVTDGGGYSKDSHPTFHLGVDYTPSNHSLVYAKFDTGYKSGGFNNNGSAPPLPYGPETVATAEIGTKNRLLDNKLELNLDGYYTSYNGYQASQFTPALGNGASGVFNVGHVHIYGAEAQMVALLSQNTKFDFNAAYVHTKLTSNSGSATAIANCTAISAPTSDICITNGATGATVDITGNQLPNAPHLSFTVGLEQSLPLGNGKLIARIDGKYSDSFFYSVFNNPNGGGTVAVPNAYNGLDTRSGSYMTGDASLTYRANSGKWEVEAYIRNFTDKLYLASAIENSNSNANNYEFAPPLTFGVRGRVKF